VAMVQMRTKTHPDHAVPLGVDLHASARGEHVVTHVWPNSPAEGAGIINGSVLVQVDGVGLESMDTAQVAALVRRNEREKAIITLRLPGTQHAFDCVVWYRAFAHPTWFEEALMSVPVPDFVSSSFHDPSKEGAWLEGSLDQAHKSGNFMLQKQADKIGSPGIQGRSPEFGNGSGQGWLDRCVAAWRPGRDAGRKVLSLPSWRENREEASAGNTQDIASLSHQSPTLANNLAADPVRKGGGGSWGFGPTFKMPALPQMQFPSFVMNTQGEEKREREKTVTGIGCTLERRCSTGEIFVIAVKPGGGCANAGVEVGSKVETIDEISVRGKPIKMLKKLCLGPAGTHTMLGIVRPVDVDDKSARVREVAVHRLLAGEGQASH